MTSIIQAFLALQWHNSPAQDPTPSLLYRSTSRAINSHWLPGTSWVWSLQVPHPRKYSLLNNSIHHSLWWDLSRASAWDYLNLHLQFKFALPGSALCLLTLKFLSLECLVLWLSSPQGYRKMLGKSFQLGLLSHCGYISAKCTPQQACSTKENEWHTNQP